jgi:hypothetical protein
MRIARITSLLAGTLVATAALGASPALAETHAPLFNFGPGGPASPEEFTNPNGIAVDESSGDVYVASLSGVSEQQTVTLEGAPTGGSFTLELEGQKTAALAVGESAPSGEQVEAALAELPNIGAGNLSVTQAGELPETVTYTLTFQGALSSRVVPRLVCDGSALTGGSSPVCDTAITTAGVENKLYKFDAEGQPVEFQALKSGVLTGAATPAKSFAFPNVAGNPAAIAVDNSTDPSDPSRGDLYVLDAGHEVIDKFNSDGEYLSQITGPFSFPPVGLGVDPSGEVRVDVKNPGSEGRYLPVEVFDDSPANAFLALVGSEMDTSGGAQVYGFATAGQPGGDYALLMPCGCAARLGPHGEHYGRVDEGSSAVAVAVDPADGHVFIDDQSALTHSVAEWDTREMNGPPIFSNAEPPQDIKSTGTFVSSFGSLQLAGSAEHEQGGIAVDGATGDVYVSNPADGRVYVFGSSAPEAVVGAPANVAQTSATLQGTVDPRGAAVTECRFEYGTTPSNDVRQPIALLEHTAPCLTEHGQPIGAGISPVAVHADIPTPGSPALQPGSLYHFRLVVSNANGESHGGGLFPTASAGFGFKRFEVSFLNRDGTPDVQAGSHPYKMRTDVVFNTQAVHASSTDLLYLALPADNVKDIALHLPPGFYGDPNATAKKCTLQQLAPGGLIDICPPESVLGQLEAEYLGGKEPPTADGKRLVNVVPPPGVAFQMAAKITVPDAFIDAGVPAGGDSGVTAVSEGFPAIVPVLRATTTIFGVPPLNPKGPLLTMPSACNGPLTSTISGDSYQHAGHFASASSVAPGMSGCAKLAFPPTIETKPDIPDASSASGLTVNAQVSQKAAQNPEGLAESALRDTTVALPPGVAINPSGGGGLEGCSEGLAGVTGSAEFNPGPEPGDKTITFTPTPLPQLQPGASFCPDASKIATAKLRTPLLPNPLEGAVYLAAQNANPFGSLLAMYMMIEDPISGTTVKIPFEVRLCQGQGEVIGGLSCQAPGQIITTAHNTPQLPFEDLELHFFGGERAPLTTPARCGTYTTRALFTPWDGNAPVESTSSFQITAGPHGGPCPGASLPFGPSLAGGTSNISAGGFSPLTTTMSREDGEQNMQSVVLRTPAGLEGLLSGVKLCPEAQANEGTCGPESLIGETTVAAGVGSDPVSVKGGRVYITEKYAGAPFGLSIVNPVKAGPFDLEHDTSNPAQNPACDCVVVRAKIDVDPTTAALTITTDPSGPHAIPHLIDGIPVQIKKVNVLINRERFTFNPTSCDPMSITGAIGSDEGALSPVSVPFQATNCAVLKYQPKLTVTTAGKASKVNGASLTFTIGYPKNAMGSQAWFNEAKFTLPKQLPARLTTIQKACLAATFESNRGACPAASIIGHAVVHTPVLPVPLEGPVYFVSYGGAAFPDAVLVLKGYGLTIELHGNTFIAKNGQTSATFKSLPDVPFETIQVTIPQGPYSEFGANLPAKAKNSFCGQKLVLPTHFKASNGLEINQNTPVAVTGCSTKLAILSHRVKKRTLTLSVYVPSTGTLKVTGKSLTTVRKATHGTENVTVTLKAKRNRKFSTKVKLTFVPSKGARQARTLKVRI